MENNTELLKEYASLAGREDAKSEARKAEILSSTSRLMPMMQTERKPRLLLVKRWSK